MTETETYNLTVDEETWPEITGRPEKFTKSFDIGQLYYTTSNVASETGINLPCIRLHVLDDLCRAINTAVQASDPHAVPIQSLYTSTLNLAEGPNSGTRSTHFINFTHVALVISLADSGSNGGQLRDLTFQKTLNSTLILPIVFSERVISPPGEQGYVASVFEFNTSVRSSLGSRSVDLNSTST